MKRIILGDMLPPLIQGMAYIRQCKYKEIKKEWDLNHPLFSKALMGNITDIENIENIFGAIFHGFDHEDLPKKMSSNMTKEIKRKMQMLLDTWSSDFIHNHKRLFLHSEDKAEFVIEWSPFIIDLLKDIEQDRQNFFFLHLLKKRLRRLPEGEEKEFLKQRIERISRSAHFILPVTNSNFHKMKKRLHSENGPNGNSSDLIFPYIYRIRE